MLGIDPNLSHKCQGINGWKPKGVRKGGESRIGKSHGEQCLHKIPDEDAKETRRLLEVMARWTPLEVLHSASLEVVTKKSLC